MQSPEYRRLFSEVSRLGAHFLSFPPRALGNYSRAELLSCRAFVAFGHAEIEHYLEQIALKKVDQAERRWSNRGSMGRFLAALVSYMKGDLTIPEKIKELNPGMKLSSAVARAAKMHRELIKNNHGIRHRNFSQIFLPIGVDPDEVSEVLVTELEELGKRRGGLVHSGSMVSISSVRDPFTVEQREIDNVVKELADFDKYVMSLR